MTAILKGRPSLVMGFVFRSRGEVDMNLVDWRVRGVSDETHLLQM